MDPAILTRRPVVLLVTVAVLSLGLGARALHVRPTFELEAFFPGHTEIRRSFDRMQAIFGRDDRTGLLLLGKAEALRADDYRAVRALVQRLASVPNVEKVLAPTNAAIAVPGPFGLPRIEDALPEGFDDARLALALERLHEPPYRRTLVSDDGTLVLVAARLAPGHVDLHDRQALQHALEAEARRMRAAGFEARVGGYPVQRAMMGDVVTAESRRLLPWVLAAILAVLALSLRSVVGVLVPLAVFVVSATWTTGLMDLLGLPPNLFATAVYVIILVVGISDSIHLLARVRELRFSLPPREALERALRELFGPCLLTSLTTAIGFASLYFSAIPMISHFGLQVALGVTAAWVVTFLLVPPLLLLAGRLAPGPRAPRAGRPLLGRVLDAIDRRIARRPRAVVLGLVLLTAAGSLGILRIDVDSPLLADLDEAHPIRVTNRLLEERMAGVINLEVLVEPPAKGDAFDPARVSRVDALARRLAALPEVITATSVVDPLRQLHLDVPGGAAALLPVALRERPDLLRPWLDPASGVMRVRLTLRNVDTHRALALFDTVGRLYEEVLGESARGHLTGQGYVAQMINERVVRQLSVSFVSALLGVILVLALALRDWRLVLATLPPNLMPVLLVAGTMGIVGIDLRYSSALVLAVVFGIAVDDTIHFIAQVRAKSDADDPVTEAFHTAGAGIVLTSLILVLGFSALLSSTFVPNRVFGLLMALTAVFALMGDLFMLPALLRLLLRRST